METFEQRLEAWKWKRKQALKVYHMVMAKILININGQPPA